MKLTGSFSNIPFDEVLLLLMQRSGTVTVWNLPNDQGLQLHIDEGRLKAFFVNYRPLKSKRQIIQWIMQLSEAQTGTFSFDPQPLEALQNILNAEINKLLLDAAIALDEVKRSTPNSKVKVSSRPQLAYSEQRWRSELSQQIDEFRRSCSEVQGIVISTRDKPLQFGNVKPIADLATLSDTSSAQRTVMPSSYGDITEMIIDTPDDVLIAYRLEARKALFAMKHLESSLHYQIRNLVLNIVEFWIEEAAAG